MATQILPKDWLETVIIRNVRKEDLPALEWGGEFTHFRRVYAEAFERAQMGYSILWVAELLEKGIIAQVFIQLICNRKELADGIRRAYLYSFRVHPDFRNQGLGSRMVRHVELDLIRRGFQVLTLNVARDNLNALRLYLRLGFHIVAAEPGVWSFVDDKGIRQTVEEPAWRMEKVLF
ncbi:MAG: GNAT family N-acetyltransferase [Chloroflexota bacterium]